MEALEVRLTRLESSVRRWRLISLLFLASAVVGVTAAWMEPKQPQVVRASKFILIGADEVPRAELSLDKDGAALVLAHPGDEPSTIRLDATAGGAGITLSASPSLQGTSIWSATPSASTFRLSSSEGLTILNQEKPGITATKLGTMPAKHWP